MVGSFSGLIEFLWVRTRYKFGMPQGNTVSVNGIDLYDEVERGEEPLLCCME